MRATYASVLVYTVTVQVAFLPLPSFAVQVIVAVPLATPVTTPVELTVATFVLEDFHVRFLFVALLGVIVAFNVSFAPFVISALDLESFILVIETKSVTVTLQVCFTFPPSVDVQVIVALPFDTPVILPL